MVSIVLHQKSPLAYKYLCKSNLVKLPCERSLRDYCTFLSVVNGIDKEEIMESIEHHGDQDVAVLIDDMKIKDGLVFNPSTGSLIGCVDCDNDD